MTSKNVQQTELRQDNWSRQIISRLRSADLDPKEIKHIILLAYNEDLRWGPDYTTIATTELQTQAIADVVARQSGIVAGIPVALAVLYAIGLKPKDCTVMREDGQQVRSGDVIIQISGTLRKILSAERTLLNFMTHLSGIATATNTWVDAVANTGCIIRDTRKTTPGLRSLEKYAVRCGGGMNHRMGLGDAALIKDNHVLAAGGIVEAITAIRIAAPNIPLEVECDTLSQVKEALAQNVKMILLDNMTIDEIKAAVALGRKYPQTRFEASGGLRLQTARATAQTGVHFLAIGAITHSSHALDIALDLRI